MHSNQYNKKKRLRDKARIQRKLFAANAARHQWAPPAERFDDIFARGAFAHRANIASYRPVGSEADPAAIEEMAQNAQMDISYPRIDSDGAMRFYALGPSGAMARDSYGIAVPAADGRLAQPMIILVPLLAFDRHGTRLGQGGGHYDRALAATAQNAATLLKIGIAWSCQEMRDLPRDPWDIPLDIILTEKEWIVTS
ncbi:MAG: 5-formyltetrahydrofolate cyclo-ligase [Sphingopyxis sp.]